MNNSELYIYELSIQQIYVINEFIKISFGSVNIFPTHPIYLLTTKNLSEFYPFSKNE